MKAHELGAVLNVDLIEKKVLDKYETDRGDALFDLKLDNEPHVCGVCNIDEKLVNEVADGVLEEVQIVVCYAHPEETDSKAQDISGDLITDNEITAVNGEELDAIEIKLPLRLRIFKKMYHRLDQFVDKLVDKYEKLSDGIGDGPLRQDIKELKEIQDMLDKIDRVQEHFRRRIEYIEKKCGCNITIFDSKLDSLAGLEEKLEYMNKKMIHHIRDQIRPAEIKGSHRLRGVRFRN